MRGGGRASGENILTCELQIMRRKSGAEGSGLGRWPLAITACGSHTGASAARPSGSAPRSIPAQSPPQAFPRQVIAYFCLPDERSQRAGGLKGALRELSQKTISTWPQLKWLHCKEDILKLIPRDSLILCSRAYRGWSDAVLTFSHLLFPETTESFREMFYFSTCFCSFP